MKNYKTLLIIYLGLTISLFPGTSCFSQISDNLYNILPDNLRPQDRRNITLPEANKILKHAFPHPNWTVDMYANTDQICYKFAQDYDKSTSREDQFDYLHTICYYLYFATDYNKNVVKGADELNSVSTKQAMIGIQYSDAFIKKFTHETKKLRIFLPNVYMYKGHFLMRLEKYVEAYYALEKSIQVSKQRNLPANVSGGHTSMAFLVGNLGLDDLAIAHLDSALAAIKEKLVKGSWEADHQMFIMHGRQLSFLSKYRKTAQNAWSDSVFSMHAQIKSPNHPFNGIVEGESNVALAALLYGQGKYNQALARIDSALSIFPDMKQRGSWGDAMAYKALILIRLGKEESGNALLKDLNFSKIDNPVIVEVFEELSKHETKRGNLQKAMDYQKQLLDFVKRKALRDLQGKSLEMEKFYQLHQREQKIMNLQETQERNTTISVSVITLAFFLLLILFFRNRINQINTKKAVKQVDVMMALNMVQIEEARELERKRLAQDLHDDFSASIAASLNYLQILSQHDNTEDNRQQTSKVLLMLKESYDRAREKSQNMYWEEHPDDFWKKTFDQVSILFSGTNMKINIDNSIVGVKLTIEVKKTILLVLKESIINIIKHADATEVVILLYDEFNRLRLEISDNGRGFKEKSDKSSLGISSLKERMKILGGEFQIVSNVPKGTSVICIFPINDDETIYLS